MKKCIICLLIILFLSNCSKLFIRDKKLDISANGLVTYLSFDGDAKDESGNGNDGIIYGALLTDDRFGNPNSAYSFDGIDDYIELENNELLNPKESISFGCWFKSNNPNKPNQALISKTENSGYSIYINDQNNNGIFRGWIFIGDDYKTLDYVSSAIKTYDWNNVIITYDGNVAKMYFNGQLVDVKNTSGKILYSPTSLIIGAEPQGESILYNFSGQIDDVIIYKRALSESEVKSISRFR